MEAIYMKPLNCYACIDTAEFTGGISSDCCKRCKEINREEVEVLSFGDGFFGNKATIARKNGSIEVVKISELIME